MFKQIYMKLKFPKTVTIGSYTFDVKKDNKSAGACFSFGDRDITIGTRRLKTDPVSVFNLICHELFEISSVITCTRYDDTSVSENYKFFYDHKEFEMTMGIFSKAVSEFIS